MKSDIEIANSIEQEDIVKVASKIGISEDNIELYGKYKAKINFDKINTNKKGKLILVTAITPTKYGEGKSTTTVGLADGLRRIGKDSIVCLREPSLGPVFGTKGGATGGGYAQVVPMEDINLHFTGDMHAITTANNLICAAIDNHIYHGNELNIDLNNITFKRCLDINDRLLRSITIGQGSKFNGVERVDGVDITVASEVMAVLCLAKDLEDFKYIIGNIIVSYNTENKPIFVKDLKVEGSIATIMKDAIKPNLVQTLEHTPALIHGGPFANIAHGCNSLIATNLGLKLSDYIVTEAGFGSDLGFEKFLDIKSRIGDLNIDAVVIVATIRALKSHITDPNTSEIDKLKEGFNNLLLHINNVKLSNLNYIVALNVFSQDTEEEKELFKELADKHNILYKEANGYLKGSLGMEELSHEVVKLCQSPKDKEYIYNNKDDILVKIEKVVKEVYCYKDYVLTEEAMKQLENIRNNKMDDLLICIAKAPTTLTLYEELKDKTLEIQGFKVSNGAGFIVVYAGNIMTMPGLSKDANIYNIDIIDNKIVGLF